MSDPSQDTNDTYYSNGTSTSGGSITPAMPINGKTKSPTIYSYFTENNLEKELKAELAEMVLVFLTSTGISLYQKDQPLVAIERGAILSAGQYAGGVIAQALNNADYFKGGKYKKYKGYIPVLIKFMTSTGLFLLGNKEVLSSNQATTTLLGESAVASVVAHYGGQYYKKYNKKKKVNESNITDIYQQY